jgi:hypothetical protein
MKRIHPTAVVSAVLLYVLLALLGAIVASIIPWLLELGEEHPRLAALVWLGILLSPVYSLAFGHHVVNAVLDGVDPAKHNAGRGLLPGVSSWWAGLYGWLVTLMSSLVASLLMAALFPPDDRGLVQAVIAMQPRSATITVHTALWIGCATALYQFERIARERSKAEA